MNLTESKNINLSRASFRRSQSSFLQMKDDSIESVCTKKIKSTMIICKEDPREQEIDDEEEFEKNKCMEVIEEDSID